jgi:hypothetical protein
VRAHSPTLRVGYVAPPRDPNLDRTTRYGAIRVAGPALPSAAEFETLAGVVKRPAATVAMCREVGVRREGVATMHERMAWTMGLLASLGLGCGGDDASAGDTGPTDGADAVGEVDAGSDDGGGDDGAPGDDGTAVPDDAAVPDATDAPGDDGSPGLCAPSWHPTACGDCLGGGGGSGCYQDCVAAACGDGRRYRAECDAASGVCRCLIDGAEVCTCVPANPPDGPLGCQPQEWGGANCCWNVG